MNDAANAREVFTKVRHGRRYLVERLGYITAPGRNVRTLVTTRAVEEIAAKCSWPVRRTEGLERVPPPTSDELLLLRALDIKGIFL